MAVMLFDYERPAANTLLLWAGVLCGPLAWILDEGLSYMLEQHSCSTGHIYLMHLITGLCFCLAILGALVARSQLSRVGEGTDTGAGPHNRSWWMARLGIALSLGFALTIIAIEVPKVILSPCD